MFNERRKKICGVTEKHRKMAPPTEFHILKEIHEFVRIISDQYLLVETKLRYSRIFSFVVRETYKRRERERGWGRERV